jgi:uncharacterized surface protein with fasciclin (FAS1) repeats
MKMTKRFALATTFMAVIGAAPALAQSRNIVETAVAAGQFQTLVAAAQAAGLVPALSAPGPLTVFAPTDRAFRRLPAGTVENLLKPENRGQLQAILTYHVVGSRIEAKDVPHRPTLVQTLNSGNSVRAVRRNGIVHIDGARVTKADINTSNGVIHVIDRVLILGQRKR